MKLETLKKVLQEKGITVVIDDPINWGLDTSGYKNKKLYAYSYFDKNLQAWIEPKRFFQYINDVHYNIFEEIIKKEKYK